jgi:hypothetical protein
LKAIWRQALKNSRHLVVAKLIVRGSSCLSEAPVAFLARRREFSNHWLNCWSVVSAIGNESGSHVIIRRWTPHDGQRRSAKITVGESEWLGNWSALLTLYIDFEWRLKTMIETWSGCGDVWFCVVKVDGYGYLLLSLLCW